MIYPIGGRIPVTSSRKVTLGNKKADPILFHLSFRKLPGTLIPRQPEDSGGDESAFTEQLPARVSFHHQSNKRFVRFTQTSQSSLKKKMLEALP